MVLCIWREVGGRKNTCTLPLLLLYYSETCYLCAPCWLCSYLGRLNLTEVYLAGVGAALGQHPQGEAKGIKAHFNMDESGLLNITNVCTGFFF